MKKREKDIITGVSVGLMGVVLLLYTFNIIIYLIFYPLYFFMSSSGYFYLDLFLLAIVSFLYGYFMVKPVKTLNGRIKLAKIALAVGIVLVILPILGMCLEAFYSSAYFGFSFYILGFFVPYLIIIIPGLALAIHGKFLLKDTKAEKRE